MWRLVHHQLRHVEELDRRRTKHSLSGEHRRAFAARWQLEHLTVLHHRRNGAVGSIVHGEEAKVIGTGIVRHPNDVRGVEREARRW